MGSLICAASDAIRALQCVKTTLQVRSRTWDRDVAEAEASKKEMEDWHELVAVS